METLALTPLQPTQFDAATELLTAAFADDPLLHYLVPADVCDRPTVMAYLFRMLLICGAGGGHSYCLSDGQTLKGVVIWMPPEQSVDLIDLLRAGLYELPFRLSLQYLPRWQAALALDQYRHQALPQPHWYLMLLAVSPALSARALATSLCSQG